MENKLTKSYYSENKERMLQRQKKKYLELSLLFESWKNNLKCSRCDEDDVSCLDFHHIESSAKEYKIKSALAAGGKTLVKEMEKCVVLCANCHRKVHAHNVEIEQNLELAKSLEKIIK